MVAAVRQDSRFVHLTQLGTIVMSPFLPRSRLALSIARRVQPKTMALRSRKTKLKALDSSLLPLAFTVDQPLDCLKVALYVNPSGAFLHVSTIGTCQLSIASQFGKSQRFQIVFVRTGFSSSALTYQPGSELAPLIVAASYLWSLSRLIAPLRRYHCWRSPER